MIRINKVIRTKIGTKLTNHQLNHMCNIALFKSRITDEEMAWMLYIFMKGDS